MKIPHLLMQIAPVCICYSLSAQIGVCKRFKPIIYPKAKLINLFWCHMKQRFSVLILQTKWEGKKAQSISDMSTPSGPHMKPSVEQEPSPEAFIPSLLLGQWLLDSDLDTDGPVLPSRTANWSWVFQSMFPKE